MPEYLSTTQDTVRSPSEVLDMGIRLARRERERLAREAQDARVAKEKLADISEEIGEFRDTANGLRQMVYSVEERNAALVAELELERNNARAADNERAGKAAKVEYLDTLCGQLMKERDALRERLTQAEKDCASWERHARESFSKHDEARAALGKLQDERVTLIRDATKARALEGQLPELLQRLESHAAQAEENAALVGDLQAEVDAHKAALSITSHEAQARALLIQQLEQTLDQGLAEKDALAAEARRSSELGREIERLQSEVDRLARERGEMDQRVREAEADAVAASDLAAKARSETDALREALQTRQTRLSELEGVAAASRDRGDVDTELKRLQGLTDRLARDVQDAELGRETAYRERATVERQREEAELERDRLAKEVARNQRDRQSYDAERERLQRDADRAREERERVESDLRRQLSEQAERLRAAEQAQAEAQRSQRASERATKDAEAVAREAARVRKENETLQQSLAGLQRESEQALLGSQTERERMTIENETLQSEVRRLTAESASLRQRRDGVDERVRGVNAENEALHGENERLHGQCEALRAENEHLGVELDRLQVELGRMQTEHESVRAEVELRRRQEDTLVTDRTRVRAELDSVRTERDRLARDQQDASSRAAAEKTRADTLEARLAALRDENASLARSVEGLTAAGVEKDDEIRKQRAATAKTNAERMDLENRLRLIEADQAAIEERVRKAAEEKHTVEVQLRRMDDSLRQQVDDADKWRRDAEAARKAEQDANSVASEAQARVVELSRQVDELRQRLDAARMARQAAEQQAEEAIAELRLVEERVAVTVENERSALKRTERQMRQRLNAWERAGEDAARTRAEVDALVRAQDTRTPAPRLADDEDATPLARLQRGEPQQRTALRAERLASLRAMREEDFLPGRAARARGPPAHAESVCGRSDGDGEEDDWDPVRRTVHDAGGRRADEVPAWSPPAREDTRRSTTRVPARGGRSSPDVSVRNDAQTLHSPLNGRYLRSPRAGSPERLVSIVPPRPTGSRRAHREGTWGTSDDEASREEVGDVVAAQAAWLRRGAWLPHDPFDSARRVDDTSPGVGWARRSRSFSPGGIRRFSASPRARSAERFVSCADGPNGQRYGGAEVSGAAGDPGELRPRRYGMPRTRVDLDRELGGPDDDGHGGGLTSLPWVDGIMLRRELREALRAQRAAEEELEALRVDYQILTRQLEQRAEVLSGAAGAGATAGTALADLATMVGAETGEELLERHIRDIVAEAEARDALELPVVGDDAGIEGAMAKAGDAPGDRSASDGPGNLLFPRSPMRERTPGKEAVALQTVLSQYERVVADRSKLAAENAVREERLAGLEKLLTATREERDRNFAELGALRDRFDLLRKMLQDKNVEQLYEELAQTREREARGLLEVTRLTREQKSSSARCTELEIRSATLDTRLEAAAAEATALKAQLSLLRDIEKRYDEVSRAVAQHDEQTRVLIANREEYEQNIAIVQRDLTAARAKASALEGELEALKARHSQDAVRLAEVSGSSAELRAHLAVLEAERAGASKRAELSEQRMDHERGRAEDLQRKLAASADAVARAEGETARLRAEADAFSASKVHLEQELAQWTAKLDVRVAEERAAAQRAVAEAERLRVELEKASTARARANDDHERALLAQREEYASERNHLQGRLSSLMDERTREHAAAQQQLGSLRASHEAELLALRRQLDDTRVAHTTEERREEGEILSLTKRLEVADSALARLRVELDAARAERASADAARSAELSAARGGAESATNKLRRELETTHAEELRALRDNVDRARADALRRRDAEHAQEKADLEALHRRALDAEAERWRAERQHDIESAVRDFREAKEREKQDALVKLRAEKDREMASLLAKKSEVAGSAAAHDVQVALEKQKEDHMSEVEALTRELRIIRRTMSTDKAQYDRDLAEFKRASDVMMSGLRREKEDAEKLATKDVAAARKEWEAAQEKQTTEVLAEHQGLQDALDELRREHTACGPRQAGLRATIAQLEGEAQRAQYELAQLARAHLDAQEAVVQLAGKQSERGDEWKRLKEEKDVLAATVAALRDRAGDAEHYESQLAQVSAEAGIHGAVLSDLQQRLEQSQKMLLDVTRQKERLESEQRALGVDRASQGARSALEQELVSATEERASLRAALEKLQQDHAVLRRKAAKKIRLMKDELDDSSRQFREQIEQQEEDDSEVVKSLSRLNGSFERLQGILTGIEHTNELESCSDLDETESHDDPCVE